MKKFRPRAFARGIRNVAKKIDRKQALRVNGNPNNRRIKMEDAVVGIEAYVAEMKATKQNNNAIGFGAEFGLERQ